MGLLAGAALLAALTNNLADPDLWGYMSFGRRFWQESAFPYHDTFSYIPVKGVWVFHEWLTGALFYLLYEKTGGLGLQVLKYTAALSTAGLAWATARRRGAPSWAAWAGLLLPVSYFSSAYSPVRAQIFSLLFLASSLFILERAKTKPRVLFFLPPIFALWCNLHGGFLAGIAATAFFAAGQIRVPQKNLAFSGALAACLLATLASPYGLGLWKNVLAHVLSPEPEIVEWEPLWRLLAAGDTASIAFAALMVLTWICALAFFRKDMPALLMLGMATFMAVSHIRFLSLFAVCFAALVPPAFPRLWKNAKKTRPIALFLAACCTGIACINVFYAFRPVFSPISPGSPFALKIPDLSQTTKRVVFYPTGGIAYIHKHGLSGNLLCKYDWGSYCVWNLYPQCKVAVDGRSETLFPAEVRAEQWEFQHGRLGWRAFLSRYPHDMILLEPDTKIYYLVSEDRQWRQVYTDTSCALFVKEKF